MSNIIATVPFFLNEIYQDMWYSGKKVLALQNEKIYFRLIKFSTM
jgi:hypothetical protein